MIRRTFVCRPDIDAKGRPSCTGGGLWLDILDDPRASLVHRPCGKVMVELGPTLVIPLERKP